MEKKLVILEINSAVFLADSKPARKFITVTRGIARKEGRALLSHTKTSQDRIWSILANQVIGSEHFRD